MHIIFSTNFFCTHFVSIWVAFKLLSFSFVCLFFCYFEYFVSFFLYFVRYFLHWKGCFWLFAYFLQQSQSFLITACHAKLDYSIFFGWFLSTKDNCNFVEVTVYPVYLKSCFIVKEITMRNLNGLYFSHMHTEDATILWLFVSVTVIKSFNPPRSDY